MDVKDHIKEAVTSIAHPHVDTDGTVYNMGNVKSSTGLFSPADDGISAE